MRAGRPPGFALDALRRAALRAPSPAPSPAAPAGRPRGGHREAHDEQVSGVTPRPCRPATQGLGAPAALHPAGASPCLIRCQPSLPRCARWTQEGWAPARRCGEPGLLASHAHLVGRSRGPFAATPRLRRLLLLLLLILHAGACWPCHLPNPCICIPSAALFNFSFHASAAGSSLFACPVSTCLDRQRTTACHPSVDGATLAVERCYHTSRWGHDTACIKSRRTGSRLGMCPPTSATGASSAVASDRLKHGRRGWL